MFSFHVGGSAAPTLYLKEWRSRGRTSYKGGYVNFMPFAASGEELQEASHMPAPTRKFAIEDLAFYLQQLGSRTTDPTPESVSLIMKQYVLSQYMQLNDYISWILDVTAFRIEEYARRIDDIDSSKSTETFRFEVLNWSWRISEYCGCMRAALYTLKISRIAPPTGNCDHTCDDDFWHIYKGLLDLKQQTADLVSRIISIMESKRSIKAANMSIEEARAVRVLTVLGVLFVPSSFTTGLFSMNEKYLPGAATFWIYLTVAIPPVLVVALTYIFITARHLRGWIKVNTFCKP